ncbi:hypothetical protein LB507_004837 [Fusarium sp. FIESC RH6]|nr:hypothetical protein LB507_004837 [Fusarium sp. FIESC RH6]
MDQRGSKRESEHDLRVKVESSNPIDLASSPSTHSAGPQEQPSSNGFVATGYSSSSAGVKPEEHTVEEVQPPSEQPGSGSDVDVDINTDTDTDTWTLEDLVNLHQISQEEFLAKYRNSAAQTNSQLVQALQSEVQAGINQVVDYIRNTFMRPAQPPTHADLENLKNQLEVEKRHSKDLQNNYNMSQHSVRYQQKEIQKANAKLQDALQERDRLRKLLDGGSLANSSKVTDDAIKGKWTEIDYNIRCLVHGLDNAPPMLSLDDKVRNRLRFLSREHLKILDDPDLRVFLMRGYLWVLIQDNVFNSGETLWGGPELRSYKASRDSLLDRIGEIEGRSEHKPSIAHVARWLAQGSTMMGEIWDKDINAFNHMMHTEVKRLRSFASDRQSRADRTGNKISDQLRDIINSAIELDKMMMCSRAVFLIEWWDTSQNPRSLQRWNPEVMEAEAWEKDLSQKSHVKLRLSPILYKFGTADGQNYDSRMVLAKSGVVCD